MKKSILLLFFTFIALNSAQAQNFGGFSPQINWLKIETPYAKIIFPVGLSNQANKVAADIDYFMAKQYSDLTFKFHRINIVLNNQTVQSNGYVTPMPYHSMYYLTSPQDANMLGTQNWLEGLCTHEFRHVWQYNQMRNHLADWAHFFWGDKGWGGYVSMIFPS
jgi:hypothetical protein